MIRLALQVHEAINPTDLHAASDGFAFVFRQPDLVTGDWTHRITHAKEAMMSGRVVHFEVPFTDGNRAKDFYQQVFGWKLNEMPEMKYTMVSSGPVAETGMPSEPGYIGGGMFEREPGFPQGPVITIDVGSALFTAGYAACSSRVYAVASGFGVQKLPLFGSFQISHAFTPWGA